MTLPGQELPELTGVNHGGFSDSRRHQWKCGFLLWKQLEGILKKALCKMRLVGIICQSTLSQVL